MAITATERSQIVELTVLMFNAAPGAEYLSQIVSVYETNGRSLQTLAGILAGTSVYAALNPNTQTAEAFADAFLTPLGLQADSLARDFIISKMNAGVSKGAIVYEAYAALNSVPDSANNQYSAANAILNNKVAVATYYSVDRGIAATDLASLQTALSGVTADPASVTSAKAAIDATIDFTLMASAASVNEGASITVHLTNGTPNTEYVLRVDSAHASDVGSQLTMVTTDANGTAHATIAVAADRTTEGAETLTISVVGQASVSTTVTVNDTSMDNTAPAITAEATLAANEGKSATFNLAAADAEGDAVTLSASAASGTVVDNGNGTFTYTPNAGFSGSDTITVTAADALGATSTQTIAVTVDANDAPIAQAGGDAANEGGAAVSGQLVATDADSGDTLTFSLDAPVEGLTLNADGSYTFDPAANTAANALVYSDTPLAIVANYTVTDALGATSQNTLTITVTPKPLTFTLTKAGTTVQEGASQVYTVTASEAVTSATDVVFTLLPGDGAAGNTGTGNTNTADFATGSFNPLTATIAVGSSTATFTVTPVNDATTELPESFTVQAQVGGSTLTLGGTTVDATTAGGVGQTFTLTTGVDTIPGLIGSANSAGTDGNDTIVALISGASTWTALDDINGGLGTDTFRINAIADMTTAPAGSVITGVENVVVNAAAKVGTFAANGTGALDLSTAFAGASAIAVNNATEVDFKAPTSAAVTVTNAVGGVEVVGGSTQTVTLATQGAAVQLSKATGHINVTSGNQGANTITIDDGTSVAVSAGMSATAATTQGAITIGGTTKPTSAVTVTNTVTNAAGADSTGSAVTINGGSTVTVTQTASQAVATAAGANNTVTQGKVIVNGADKITDVTISQSAAATAANTVLAATGVVETSTATFVALTAGQTLTFNGLTFTAGAAGTTAAETAAAWANLENGARQGYSTKGTYSGVFSTEGWTTGAASGAAVVFTGSSAGARTDLSGNWAGTGTAPTITGTTQGVTAVTAAGKGGVLQGVVEIDDAGAEADTLTTVSVTGYANASFVKSDALTSLTLAKNTANAGIAVHNNTATTLGLTLDTLATGSTVNLDAAAAKYTTLNITATGGNSVANVTAAAVTGLTVNGSKSVNLTGSTFTALKTVTVKDSAGITLNASGANVTAVDTTATTGTSTITIDATKATYAGGAGVDKVTLSAAAPSKSVSLGGGDDTLTLATGTTTSTGALSGGDGVDTLAIEMANAVTASGTATFQNAIDSFEKLSIVQVALGAAGTVNMANLDNISYVLNNNLGGLLTLDNFASGGTVELTGAGNGATVLVKDAATGTADSLNVVLSSTAGIAAGTVTAANVESISINADDIATTATGITDSLTLVATKATSLTITGDANLTLTNTGNTALKTINASSMTGALTVTAAGTVAETITGGSGNDQLTASAAADVLIGNAGNDTLIAGSGLATLTGGAGNDTFVIQTASTNVNSYATITDAARGDYIRLADTAGAETFSSTAISLAPTAVFQDYANAAIATNTVQGGIVWFQYGGDTYIVQESGNNTANTFTNGTDLIVKLTGVVDLSTASFDTAAIEIRIA